MSNDSKPLVSVIVLMASYPTRKKIKIIGLLSLFEIVLIREEDGLILLLDSIAPCKRARRVLNIHIFYPYSAKSSVLPHINDTARSLNHQSF